MIRHVAAIAAIGVFLATISGWAEEFKLPPNARQLSSRVSPADTYFLPIAAFADGQVPSRRFEGRVERQTWRIAGTGATTLQLLEPLRDQVTKLGFDVVFECEDTRCGGFDFRFNVEIVPAPDMFVDFRNFRFLSAVRDDSNAISLLVSRNRNAAFVQIVFVTADGDSALSVAPNGDAVAPPETGAEPGSLAERLISEGHVVLADLSFESGAVDLRNGTYQSLSQLARFLTDNPGYVIALVGHTDSVGSLQANISLSRQRAQSVRARLIEDYGIDPARIEAGGMGYLSPVATNLTPEGREANRRVEAVLLSDDG